MHDTTNATLTSQSSPRPGRFTPSTTRRISCSSRTSPPTQSPTPSAQRASNTSAISSWRGQARDVRALWTAECRMLAMRFTCRMSRACQIGVERLCLLSEGRPDRRTWSSNWVVSPQFSRQVQLLSYCHAFKFKPQQLQHSSDILLGNLAQDQNFQRQSVSASIVAKW